MKKRKKATQVDVCPLRNPVAKFASRFNNAHVFKDKTKYHRRAKHQGKEPFPITLLNGIIGKGFFSFTYRNL